MTLSNAIHDVWVKARFNVLCCLVDIQAQAQKRAQRLARRAADRHETFHRPLRVLVSENLWLVNGQPKPPQ